MTADVPAETQPQGRGRRAPSSARPTARASGPTAAASSSARCTLRLAMITCTNRGRSSVAMCSGSLGRGPKTVWEHHQPAVMGCSRVMFSAVSASSASYGEPLHRKFASVMVGTLGCSHGVACHSPESPERLGRQRRKPERGPRRRRPPRRQSCHRGALCSLFAGSCSLQHPGPLDALA